MDSLRPAVATVGVLLIFTVLGCDTSGPTTAVLNADSPEPPTVKYEIRYTSDDLNENDEVEAASLNPDDLESVLRENGFERSDVVSARIDSVTLERISSPTQDASTNPKAVATPNVFSYLLGAEVYLGNDATGPRIAAGQFETTQRFVSLPVTTRDVTPVVRDGAVPSFLRLEVEDPSNVPDSPDQDAVELVVYYRLEVEGV
ncbi:MAG: hypothetical protein ACLFTE_04210 [Salinivenus sp.]